MRGLNGVQMKKEKVPLEDHGQEPHSPKERKISLKNEFFTAPYFTPYQRSYSIEGHLPSKVVFRQSLSSVKFCLPSNVVFCQRSSSVKGRLPSMVVFRKRSSSVKGCLLSKVVFVKGRLPLLGHFHFWVLVLSVA